MPPNTHLFVELFSIVLLLLWLKQQLFRRDFFPFFTFHSVRYLQFAELTADYGLILAVYKLCAFDITIL